jgi:organic radical activating enzyme
MVNMNPWKTYVNGNYTVKINTLNGTKIRETEEDDFKASHAENIDIKICDYCDMGCNYCHEGSTVDGKFGDLLNESFIGSLHAYQEVAIGGGDASSHPGLIPFLERLRNKEVIANLTVHQTHFMEKQDLIRRLVDEKLISGIGISVVNANDRFIMTVLKYPNAVLHTINGVLNEETVNKLADKNLKLLILGYKHLRRGNDFYSKAEPKILANQEWLYNNLSEIVKKFRVVSFDNLAIEQLNVRRLMSQEKWDEFYMGDEGSATFYIDMVNRKFAESSTAPLNERFDLLGSVDEMFQVIKRNVK